MHYTLVQTVDNANAASAVDLLTCILLLKTYADLTCSTKVLKISGLCLVYSSERISTNLLSINRWTKTSN